MITWLKNLFRRKPKYGPEIRDAAHVVSIIAEAAQLALRARKWQLPADLTPIVDDVYRALPPSVGDVDTVPMRADAASLIQVVVLAVYRVDAWMKD